MFGWFKRSGSSDAPQVGAVEPALTESELRDDELSAYLDGELAPEAVRSLEARLASDADLTEALDGLRVVRDTLATLEVVRAPRSFALPAQPAPERPAGFGRLDLLARLGAMTAAVAFVVVLASDLSGDDAPTSTPVLEASLSAPVAAESNAGGGAAAADTSALESAPARGEDSAGSDGGGDATDEAPATEPADADAVDATATALPPTTEATVEAAAAASTDLRATQGPAAPDSGSTTDTENSDPESTTTEPAAGDSAAGGAAVAPPPAVQPTQAAVDATQAPGAAATEVADEAASSPADDDAARDGSAAGAGTAQPQPALVPQAGDTALAVEESAGALLTEDGAEPSGLAIGLGVIAAVLAAIAGLLWWRGRSQAAGPA